MPNDDMNAKPTAAGTTTDDPNKPHDDESPKPTAAGTYDPSKPLQFKVAPNIVEDLGLNLYTSLPRVLAEFVANAYDADSAAADISIDLKAITDARAAMRKAYKAEQKQAEKDGPAAVEALALDPLESRTLPANIKIIVADTGGGMSREDLAKKFLIAGRRRRKEETETRTTKNRLIMGRKGLGKLAGFGVARRVELITRRAGDSHATKITLSYEKLVEMQRVDEVEIDETKLDDGGEIALSGTRIELSELMYDPTKSTKDTISNELSQHFEMVRPDDFVVRLNNMPVEPLIREYAFAWPQPEAKLGELVEESFLTETGQKLFFKYRMRFTKDDNSLPAQRRGVRIYARGRLASAPSLLDADTNMHGFRMTDYLDGVVEADFLDAFPTDFIATDRQSLRWESPLLAPMKVILSEAIEEACKECQKLRDGRMPGVVKKDLFTQTAIRDAKLTGRDKTLAIRIGTTLAKACKRGVKDPIYHTKFPEILRGIGHGNLLTAIAGLAKEEHPDLREVSAKIIALTHEEIDSFVSLARGRVNAISALKKIVLAADFADKKKENEVQKLLEGAPWMVDPIYAPTMSANESLSTLYKRLAKELGIGSYAPADAAGTDDRPDLVFFLGSEAGGRLNIVELKAPNVPLSSDHLDQLISYMKRTKDWLRLNASGHGFTVHGDLIGMLDVTSQARKQLALRDRIDDEGASAKWRVRTFDELLTQTQQAHAEILAAHAGAASRDDADDDDDDDGADDE